MALWKSLAPWVLLLEQESHLLYINLEYKKLGYKIYTTFYRVDWDFMPFVSLLCHKFVLLKFILPFLSLVTETNSFTQFKLRTPISNLKLKQIVSCLILLPLYEEFTRVVHSHTLLRLRYLPFSLMLIQGLKEYKQETINLNTKFCR